LLDCFCRTGFPQTDFGATRDWKRNPGAADASMTDGSGPCADGNRRIDR